MTTETWTAAADTTETWSGTEYYVYPAEYVDRFYVAPNGVYFTVWTAVPETAETWA